MKFISFLLCVVITASGCVSSDNQSQEQISAFDISETTPSSAESDITVHRHEWSSVRAYPSYYEHLCYSHVGAITLSYGVPGNENRCANGLCGPDEPQTRNEFIYGEEYLECPAPDGNPLGERQYVDSSFDTYIQFPLVEESWHVIPLKVSDYSSSMGVWFQIGPYYLFNNSYSSSSLEFYVYVEHEQCKGSERSDERAAYNNELMKNLRRLKIAHHRPAYPNMPEHLEWWYNASYIDIQFKQLGTSFESRTDLDFATLEQCPHPQDVESIHDVVFPELPTLTL